MPNLQIIHSSPQEVEQAFYEALESADLEALMELWADDETVVCVHPGGPRVEGYHDIRESWRDILSAGGLQIRTIPLHQMDGGLLVVLHSMVQVAMTGERGENRMAQINVTNVYRKGAYGWRIVLHHASPALEIDAEDNGDDDFPDFDIHPTLH